jgi:hypothetical protein
VVSVLGGLVDIDSDPIEPLTMRRGEGVPCSPSK